MRFAVFAIALMPLFGCGQNAPPAVIPPAPVATPVAPPVADGAPRTAGANATPTPPTAAAPVASAPAAPNHAAMGGAAKPGGAALAGKLLERLEAATYSYLRIQPADVWAAIPVTQVAVGADVSIADPMPMSDFESKALGRRFARIYFGTLGTPSAEAPVAGKLVERIDGGEYSYLRIQPAEAWAAVPQVEVAVGSDVAIARPELMFGFESKTLGRRFDRIYFGTMQGAGEGQGQGQGHGAAAGMGAAEGPNVAAPITKAEGPAGRTVAEVFAQKSALKDQPVAVRGRVVKSTSGVMGKNWLHLRDGSGSDAGQDNDLTVTTSDTAAVGEIVVVKGAVHLDKDFGAGYAYGVIVEDAAVSR